jgi:hypothetical protein
VEPLETRDVPSNFTLDPRVQVSGPSPFNGCPDQPELFRNAETENFVAVDPSNSQHSVAVWFQDLADGIVSAATFDGGASWQSAVVPGLTLCSGGTYPTASDPWVSFAPNGDVYASSVENHFFEVGRADNAIRVNKSTDGGRTWGAPVTLIEEHDSGFLNDKPSITADPGNPGYVYTVWFRDEATDQRGTRNETMFARSTDAGRTWEPARVIAVAGNDDPIASHQVLVKPDGTLVIVAEEDVRHGASIDSFLSSFRSTDRGATWSAPVRGPQMFRNTPFDPETGQTTIDGNPDFAVDPNNGNLYAVWPDARFLGGQYDSIAFSLSTNGGLSWSAPVKINQTPTTTALGNQQAFLPSVAVVADGTVGVTYYDFRNPDPNPGPGLWTDYWFIHGHPATDLTNPANWDDELRLTNASFDLEKAPNAAPKGLFVGDYEGLAAAGDDFVPTWSMPHGTDLASIFSRRVRAPGPAQPGRAAGVGAAPAAPPPGGTLAIADVALARYDAGGGRLDATFGSGGKVIIGLGSTSDEGRAIAAPSDGKIVVAGITWGNDTGYDFAMARYAGVGTFGPAAIDVGIADVAGTTLGSAPDHTVWLDDAAVLAK